MIIKLNIPLMVLFITITDHQSGNAERLAGVTKIIQQLDGQYKPGLIDPAEYETCLVIPIKGKPPLLEYFTIGICPSSIFSNKHINKFCCYRF